MYSRKIRKHNKFQYIANALNQDEDTQKVNKQTNKQKQQQQQQQHQEQQQHKSLSPPNTNTRLVMSN